MPPTTAATAIHVPTDDARHLLGELVGGTGRGETDVPDVIVEIEVVVLDPVRPIEFERDVDDLAAQRFEMTDHDTEPFPHGGERIEVRQTAVRRC